MLNHENNHLPLYTTDEATGIHYTLHGDYYLPDLEISEDAVPVGHWGMLRAEHLQNEHPGRYSYLLLSGKLMEHVRSVDEQARQRICTLMKHYQQTLGITEELKATDQLRWVLLMNTARHDAEENVLHEIVFD